MELRFAVVEDRLPDAQRLESLLRLAFGGGHTLVCDHYESGDAFLQAISHLQSWLFVFAQKQIAV